MERWLDAYARSSDPPADEFIRPGVSAPTTARCFVACPPRPKRRPGERGLFHSVDSALDRANISLHPGEAIALALLISLVVGALVGALTRNVLLGVLVAAVAMLFVFAVAEANR